MFYVFNIHIDTRQLVYKHIFSILLQSFNLYSIDSIVFINTYVYLYFFKEMLVLINRLCLCVCNFFIRNISYLCFRFVFCSSLLMLIYCTFPMYASQCTGYGTPVAGYWCVILIENHALHLISECHKSQRGRYLN